MRLRRETGDFSIKIRQDNQPIYIPKDLKPKDLIGAIAEMPSGPVFTVIAVTKPLDENVLALVLGGTSNKLLYNASTGEVTIETGTSGA